MNTVSEQVGITNKKRSEATEEVDKYFSDEGVSSTRENSFNMVKFVMQNYVPNNPRLNTVVYWKTGKYNV